MLIDKEIERQKERYIESRRKRATEICNETDSIETERENRDRETEAVKQRDREPIYR